MQIGNIRSNMLLFKGKQPSKKEVIRQSKSENNSFETIKNKKVDKSKNGKFDISECIKNFGKGVLSPLKAVIEHPVMSIVAVAGSAFLCSLIPVLTPILAVGFGALSVFQLGKGVFEVAKNIKNKEYDSAEKSFNTVGQGAVETFMSVTGMKQSAKIAKEAKLMSELKSTSLTTAQKETIALEVKNGSYADAFKEIAKLFTTKDGIKAIGKQFKPSSIFQRGKDMYNHIFKKEEITKIKKESVNFKDTEEGKRRANLSTEEIEKDVQKLYKEAFDEYDIPDELRPKIKVVNYDINTGGGYRTNEHSIEINEAAYKEGLFDLPNVIKHEATHAKEAILRQRLPMAEKKKLAEEYLLGRISNGDKENVVIGGGILGNETMKSPRLTANLKQQFARLAKDKLYKNCEYTNDDLIQLVTPLIDSNPDFVTQYGSRDEAIQILSKYAKSHHLRYNFAMDYATGFNTQGVDLSKLKDLTPDELLVAKKSFVNGIDCVESNAANSYIFGLGDYTQYQFTPEEVLAQQQGNNFQISKLQAQLDNLRKKPNYDVADEARLLDLIKQCELTIEYKTKGELMYRLHTESLNNPKNQELAQQVIALKNELQEIDMKIKDISFGTHVNEYSSYKVLQGPELGATVSFPYTIINAVDILTKGKNIESKNK